LPSFRVVTPFRPFKPESKEQKDVETNGGPFDWLAAIAMMRESVLRACGAEVVTLTDVDTDLPGPTFRYHTLSRRLMIWIIEVALRYIGSADFDRDTILVMPDMLVFGDLGRWFRVGDFDLGLVAREHPDRPLLNSVQFWPVARRLALGRLYAAALEETRNLTEAEVVWGGDTIPFARLFQPVRPGSRVVHRLGIVRYFDADQVLKAFTTPLFRKPKPDGVVVDFRYLRKLHMRSYFERTFPPMLEARGWFFADGDRFMAQELDAGGGYQRAHLEAALKIAKTRRACRVAIDGGAHVGTWSVPLAKQFERVVAFEPSADTYEALMANLAKRQATNVEARQLALGAAPGRVAMTLEGDDRAKRTGNLGARYVTKGDAVKVIALDSLELEDVDFLKLDVEGSEVDALTGAEQTLRRCRPIVLFEDKGLWARYGYARQAPHMLLGALGMVPLQRVMMDEIWGWPA
jgi:FkbM family methyltransferase